MEPDSRFDLVLVRFIPLFLFVVALVSCGSTEDPAPEADVIVSFDGTSCVNTGESVLNEGGAKIYYHNQTGDKMQFSVLWLRSEAGFRGALAAIPEGSEKEGIIAFPAGARLISWLRAEPLQEHTELVILEPGWYLVNCFLVPADETNPNHLWRAESFEVPSTPAAEG